MMKFYRHSILFAVVAVTIACGNNKNAQPAIESFPVTDVIKMDTTIYTDYVTELHAVQNVEIRARVSGYLEKNWVDEGAHVKKGQLLFSINSQEYQQELSKAKALYKSAVAEVKAAELDYKNVSQLASSKIVSTTELELAKNKLDAQKAKLEEALAHQNHAQLRLSNTEIRAPFDGIINRIPNKMGSLIEEGTLLTTISSNDEVYAYFDVSEKEYLNFAKSVKNDEINSRLVGLILADGSEHEAKGVIETVEGAIDANTGTIAFRARFKNTGMLIKHGASGKVRLYKKLKNALIIPQKSTYEIQDKMYVMVVDKQNRVLARNIIVSSRVPHLFIVGRGLSAGEQVVYEGTQRLVSGQEIKPVFISFKELLQQIADKD